MSTQRSFKIMQFDTRPSLQLAITVEESMRLRPTSARFVMTDLDGKTVLNRLAIISKDGVLEHKWAARDTAKPGLFHAVFIVSYAHGEKQTFPAGKMMVKIIASLKG